MLDFLGIGAQKAGTSWLHANLVRHPHLRLPDQKEVHFWDRERHRGVDWYRAAFDAVPEGCRGGEITPAYAILSPEVVAEVRAHFPDLRLLFCMRNPIDRAWSSALMALAKAELTMPEASDQWFLDHVHSEGSLRRGDYEACLKTWLRHFPGDRFLIIRFEAIASEPTEVLARCADHLGVSPAPFRLLPAEVVRRPVNAGSRDGIRPALLARLREIYLPKIERLERFLGADLSGWRA